MSTELELSPGLIGHVTTLAERIEYSKALAPADLLPPAFRGKPANVLLAMDMAESLGRTAIDVMQNAAVISGKLGLSAEFMRSLVLASGHRLRVYMDNGTAIAQGVRRDDPEFTYEARWDMDRAKAAGLGSGDNWKKHPSAMLKARATTELCRDAFADVIHGFRSAEELADMPVTVPQSSAGDRLRAAVNLPPAPVEGETDPAQIPLIDNPLPHNVADPINQPQSKKVHALFRRKGFVDRDDALSFVSATIDRTVVTTNDLSHAEASQVLDALEALEDVTT